MDLFSTKIAYASLDEFLVKVSVEVINPLIIAFFAVAIAIFLYGVLEFVMNQDNEEAKTKGKSHMIWGVVGITIMMAAWPILVVIKNTFELDEIKIDKKGNFDVDVDLGP